MRCTFGESRNATPFWPVSGCRRQSVRLLQQMNVWKRRSSALMSQTSSWLPLQPISGKKQIV